MDNFNMNLEEEKPIVIKREQVRSLMVPEAISKAFLFMFAALLITAFAAYTTDFVTAYRLVSGSGFYVLLIAELLIVFASNYAIRKNIPVLAAILYVVYSYLTGMTMSVIFLAYSTASVTSIFLITAAVFAIMAVYGLITDTDLSSVGNLLFMGLLGIIIASAVNLLILDSSFIDTVICCVGVVIFVGLTAYDTQRLKKNVENATDDDVLILALYGGFELYLDFINLFLKLLRLFGKRD